MKRILITGATGNVGFEVIRFLFRNSNGYRIVAGVRNIVEAKRKLKGYENLEYVAFDFENPATFEGALENVDSVFLLRPPHISDVDQYFKPLIESVAKHQIGELVFLSVQGVEKSSVIPHHKIEKLLIDSGISYIFLRPSYFMQNLTTTLLKDIQEKRKIYLPAGKAKFNWIDIENIGEISAILLDRFNEFSNRAIELTGYENKNFGEVAKLISVTTGKKIDYQSPNPFRFFSVKMKEGMLTGMIVVMILLHYLPRFQKEPQISDFYNQLTGKSPCSLKEFIEREQNRF